MSKLPIELEKNKIETFCKRHHINYLALFGSVTTKKFSDESDVDVLVQFDKSHTPHLLGIVEMESELSEMIGRHVDLRTLNDLSPYFREDVVNNANVIYGQ